MNNYNTLKNYYCLLPKDIKLDTYTKVQAKSKSHAIKLVHKEYDVRARNLKIMKVLTDKDIENKGMYTVFLSDNEYKIVKS